MGQACTSYVQVQSGDGCAQLASRCNISPADFTKYNPSPTFCSSLKPGGYACCSPGSLPDFTPKPDASGNCYVYTVKSGDTCATIAAAKSMDWTKIDGYNTQTWGYTGCSNIQIGQNICLSSGSPPFPAPVTGTVCGPQVPGTQKPTGGSPWDWAKLNQCPLNACCDQWGQCGVTPDFCTNTTKPGGAPGTALPNTNGCISNCGTDVVQTPGKNEQFRIGYFESWNLQRPCDVMDVSKVNANGYYTHVHWGFANITSSWNVDVSGAQDQFNGFLKVSNVKKILSFGGWGLSTSPATFEIFRTGVLDGNRQVLATNIVNFIQANNLDGVDFDWEYPGAQDIPGIPADRLDSGANYAKFLALVRAALPQGKTLSIALPASYWYLKGFAPMSMFDKSVDYYVYMTYDLHGQWDYNNKFTDPGCPGGNCLRSHVNKTETAYALAMLTKAGIPSYKIMPGLALYGRSFGMTDPLCTGPMCHYGGPGSTAIPGVCTGTAGYLSNVEINSIIATANENDGPNTASILLMEDEGDILVYNSTQWVSYLSPSSYTSRQQWYQSLGFGGSADWAMDLNTTYSNNGTGSAETVDDDDFGDWVTCPDTTYPDMVSLSAASAAGSIPDDCVPEMSMYTISNMLDVAWNNYSVINNNYDELFTYYVEYINDVVPNFLIDDFFFNQSATQEGAIVMKQGYGQGFFNCEYPVGSTPYNCLSRPFDTRQGTRKLTLVDPDGFYKALSDNGILPGWVDFGDYTYKLSLQGHPIVLQFTGFPIRNASMVVTNPKDIITNGFPNVPNMKADMMATKLEIMAGMWSGGDPNAGPLAYGPAVYTLQQAIEGMAEAKNIGAQQQKTDEEEERQRKIDLILTIIGVALLFVPFVGEEAASALGLAQLAKIIALGGELANGALAVYSTVEDPSSALVNILGMLFGLGGIAKAARDATGLGDIARLTRGMKGSEISSLGKLFDDGETRLTTIVNKVCGI